MRKTPQTSDRKSLLSNVVLVLLLLAGTFSISCYATSSHFAKQAPKTEVLASSFRTKSAATTISQKQEELAAHPQHSSLFSWRLFAFDRTVKIRLGHLFGVHLPNLSFYILLKHNTLPRSLVALIF